MNRTVSLIAEGFSYLKAPRWRDGRLWVSDFYTQKVLAIGLDGSVEQIALVPAQPSGLGWLTDGRLLVVTMRGHEMLRIEPSGDIVTHAVVGDAGGSLNDMVVDHYGRAYVGNYGFDLMGDAPIAPTQIHLVGIAGDVRVVADDLYFPNGMVLTPESVLIVAETFGNRLTAFDVDTDGSLSNRRVWAEFGPLPSGSSIAEARQSLDVAPTGICADNEGAIWVTDGLHQRVLRVRQGGEVVEEISAGELDLFSCMLGGDDGRTLFLCAAPSYEELERRDRREAKLLSVRVDVPHGSLP